MNGDGELDGAAKVKLDDLEESALADVSVPSVEAAPKLKPDVVEEFPPKLVLPGASVVPNPNIEAPFELVPKADVEPKSELLDPNALGTPKGVDFVSSFARHATSLPSMTSPQAAMVTLGIGTCVFWFVSILPSASTT